MSSLQLVTVEAVLLEIIGCEVIVKKIMMLKVKGVALDGCSYATTAAGNKV